MAEKGQSMRRRCVADIILVCTHGDRSAKGAIGCPLKHFKWVHVLYSKDFLNFGVTHFDLLG